MNVDLAQELLNELGSSLKNLETEQSALLQFLKDNGVLTDDQFAPYLAQAGTASSVRWRAAHIRLESLISSERQKEEKLREDEKSQTSAGQAPGQNRESEAKTKNEAGDATPAPWTGEAKLNGTGDESAKQSAPEKDDKQDEHAASEKKKLVTASKIA
jgi:hypothetical protein